MTTPPTAAGPRWLYLHGFASGPSSTKGVRIAGHFGGRGVEVERLDLRVPSFERLRLSAMIDAVKQAIGGERDRAVVMGSSLGGLTACRVAEEDARVCALVLLAPAFRIMERWRLRLGEDGFRAWRERGWLEVDDYAEKRRARVDFGFAADAAEVDERSGGWPDVRVPTLILHGRHDEVVDIELSRRFAAGKRHVRLIEVDDGHELVASIPHILREAEAFLRPCIGS
ncbi:YqiA/YcfP family alpha/beta fold hydrolase [Sorangium sp. So ce131]|uniref:YqiA/YcfP family alpha/beta fold hydrolase n=1 Tax=Sorangium sp. So ce131 TaxID=3133282 RepID=UPI003F63580D